MNSACLIGLVACLPRPVGGDGEVGFLLLTQRDASGGSVDRHRVILPARHTADLAEFSPGATVYVEGHLARHGERQRVSVVAHRAWSIAPAPPAPEEDRSSGTHASPREHQRAGHARRVAIGTARERLIWVRPTTVRPRSAPMGAPTPARGPESGPQTTAHCRPLAVTDL